MSTIHRLAMGLALVGSVFVSGCYAEAGTATVTSGAVADDDGYEPAYYDGYVVYYEAGRPYYYDRGVVVWVPQSSPHYVGLVNHWHVYGPRYNAWYGHSGYRYRAYRSAPGHYVYHGHGTPARRHR